jgi:hypothetical protein
VPANQRGLLSIGYKSHCLAQTQQKWMFEKAAVIGGCSGMDFCFLHLKPVAWSQGLRRYPKNIEGPVLRATCTAVSKFLLSDRYKLQDAQIELSIFRGELDALEERKELSEVAIGGIWWPGITRSTCTVSFS